MLRPTEDVFLAGLPAALLTRKLPRVGEIALAMEYYKLEDKDGPKEAKKKVAEDVDVESLHSYNQPSEDSTES